MNKNKQIFIFFLLCFFLSFLIFSPFFLASLRGFKPELRFTGDLQIACLPAFIQAGKYFKDFVYYGIDFFTANGSSSFFNRPNMPSYFMPQFILQNLFRFSSNSHEIKLFFLQMWLNGFVALLFTTLLLNKILRIDLLPSLFGGTLFLLLIFSSYGQISFFNVACYFPVLIYALSFSLINKTSLYQKILLSIPIVAIITAGYLPLAIMGLCAAVCASIVLSRTIVNKILKFKDFYVVLIIGLFVSSFYLISMIKAVQIVPAMPKTPLSESMFFADLALTFKGIFHLFIASSSNDSGEGPYFRLGLPILILLFISYSSIFKSANRHLKELSVLCLIIFLFSLLLGMGRFSGFAEIFFYAVPGLGGMHGYQRYTVISVLFLVIGLVIAMLDFYKTKSTLNLKIPSLLIGLIFLCIFLFPEILIKNQISVPMLFTECFISVILLLALNFRGNYKFWILITLPILFHQTSLIYMSTNWASISNPGATSTDIVNNENKKNDLVNYFYSNSNKLLVKYIDLTPEIEKNGGVPHNFPWFIRYDVTESRRISSYMGYDQGLSQQLEYAQKFSYYGKFDPQYLSDSGVDYFIYDEKTKIKESSFFLNYIDNSIPEHAIGNGFFAAKAKQESNHNNNVFDNGIFKIYSPDLNFKVTKFNTNWASYIDFIYSTTEPSLLKFELFPHKYWQYEINGLKVKPALKSSGLAYFELPSGINRFSIKYSNLPNLFFVFLYFLYLLIIILILLSYLYKIIKKYFT